MVKYADGPEATVAIEVKASPSTLWALVTDINLPAEFSNEFQGADWVEPATGPGLGAKFVGHNQHEAIGEWDATCTISDCIVDQKFGWVVNDADAPSAYWCFTLVPLDDGSTKLAQYARMGPGRSGLTGAIEAMPDKEEAIVARRLGDWTANMESTVAGIKALAETSESA
ncbi:MAG: SRPBCC family protein [Actinobacteria bacterium]|nr:SRPBCC family protein [Actinomycetota bacterium]